MKRLATITGWTGWRRIAPAAASVLINAAALLIVTTSMAAKGAEAPRRALPPTPPAITVTLISELPPPPRPQPPQSAPRAPSAAKPQGEAPQTPPATRPDKPKKSEPSAPQASTGIAAAHEEEGVYIGPPGVAQAGPPLGLRGLLQKDPCNTVDQKMRADCDSRWGKLLADGSLTQAPTQDQLKAMYPGFADEPSCGSKHMGCIKGAWKSANGTRAVRNTGPMSAGRINGADMGQGRLGPHNEYQRDPGFGD